MRRAIFWTVTLSMLTAACAARRPRPDAAASFRVLKASERSYTLAGPGPGAPPVELGKLMEQQYGYVAGRGYIDVLPGMRLSAQRAYFRDEGRAELKSYVGTETRRWVWDPPRFRFVGNDAAPGSTRPGGHAADCRAHRYGTAQTAAVPPVFSDPLTCQRARLAARLRSDRRARCGGAGSSE